jgi:hypothetical protein
MWQHDFASCQNYFSVKMVAMPTRDELDRQRQQNEAVLHNPHRCNIPSGSRLLLARDRLEAERDQIEYDLGQQDGPPDSRKLSRVP